ncbi:hypothetical protein [Ferruginibacter sp.]
MQNTPKTVLPLLMVFLIVNAFLLTGVSFFEKHGIDRYVLIAANTLFFSYQFHCFFTTAQGIAK